MARHRLFGLVIDSGIDLPELTQSAHLDALAPADVLIECIEPKPVEFDEQPAGNAHHSSFAVARVGRFTVSDGAKIEVVPDPRSDPKNIRLYLQGSAMGILLHQRGLLPLHANAVIIGDKAFAFMGKSGAGKSTLASWFHDRGYPILTDDVCVVTFGARKVAMAWPGLSRLRLWREAVEASGRDPTKLEASFVGDSQFDKFDVPFDPGLIAEDPVPLAGIFLLEQGDVLDMISLAGVDAVKALFENTYRGGLLASMGDQRAHWQACMTLAAGNLVYRLVRPWGHDRMADVGEAILKSVRVGSQ